MCVQYLGYPPLKSGAQSPPNFGDFRGLHNLTTNVMALLFCSIIRLWYITSNVTGRHRGPKRKHTFVCRYVVPPGECYGIMPLSYVATCFHRAVWYRTLSVACI